MKQKMLYQIAVVDHTSARTRVTKKEPVLAQSCVRFCFCVSAVDRLVNTPSSAPSTMVAFNSVIAAATVGAACAFAPSSMMGAQLKTTTAAHSATQMGLEQYKKELAETAKKIASPGECWCSSTKRAIAKRFIVFDVMHS